MTEADANMLVLAAIICGGALFGFFCVGEPPAWHAWLAHRREQARLDAETRIRLEEIKLRMLESKSPS